MGEADADTDLLENILAIMTLGLITSCVIGVWIVIHVVTVVRRCYKGRQPLVWTRANRSGSRAPQNWDRVIGYSDQHER